MNTFADTFFFIPRRHKDGNGRKVDRFRSMAGSMKENDIAQKDYQNQCLEIDKIHDQPMSEVISHSLSTLGCNAPGYPGAQDGPLPKVGAMGPG